MALKPPGRFLRSGKVKDIYELDSNLLLFDFTDRVSAFDMVLPSTIPRKGEVLCRLSAHLFQTLGFPHHMVRLAGPNWMVVRKMDMMPVECVVRGYLYGSLYERFARGEVKLSVEKVLAAKLPEPYFDPTTKSDIKDEPITEDEIVAQGRMSSKELQQVKRTTISTYERLREKAASAGFILADLKLEFGRSDGGSIILGDSIGPDEFRMWPSNAYSPGRSQDSYDKQPIRDWLISVGYKERLDVAKKSGTPRPEPPALPPELIDETSKRYAFIYDRLTSTSL